MKTTKLLSIFLIFIVLSGTMVAQEPITVPQMTDFQKQKRVYWLFNYTVMLGASYAKSQGKTIEDFAKYYGEVGKKSWNPKLGFKGFINGTLYNWVSWCSETNPGVEILFDSDAQFKFKAPLEIRKSISDSGYGSVGFYELMTMYRIIFEVIADYHGVKYEQKLLENDSWIEITITK